MPKVPARQIPVVPPPRQRGSVWATGERARARQVTMAPVLAWDHRAFHFSHRHQKTAEFRAQTRLLRDVVVRARLRVRQDQFGLRWMVDMVGCTALYLSDRRLRIYFGVGSSIDSFARARQGDYARYHEIVHGNHPDPDRRIAHGHGTGNQL